MIRTCRDAFRTVEGSYIRKEKFKPVFNELGQVKEVISESPVHETPRLPRFARNDRKILNSEIATVSFHSASR